MGAYLKLAAIVGTTKTRNRPLELQIRGKDGDFTLAVVEMGIIKANGRKRIKAVRTLATAPLTIGEQDEAAMDLARQLTIDGALPAGLSEDD